ncbi:hypothetical protein JCM3775_002307 [Rhodotorula graminis]
MAQDGRRAFTPADKQHLAHFLSTIPPDKRGTPSTHKEMERRYPEHTYQAWMNHYNRVDKDGIDRLIEGIRRQRQRDNKAARSAKGKARARDDDDHDDDDDDDDEHDHAADDTAPPAKKNKKKRKALELPRPSSSSSDDDSDAPRRKPRSNARKKYTDDDFKQLVRVLYRAEQESWLKQRIYTELEAYDPDHSVQSWQTYHRDRRDVVDQSLREYRKRMKAAKQTKKDKKRRKRDATTESAASSTLPPPRKKQKQKQDPIELRSDDDDDDDAPGPSTQAQPRPVPVASSSSKAAHPVASTSTSAAQAAAATSTTAAPARAPRASLPAQPTASAPAKAPRPSLPAPSTAPLASSSAPSGKGKRRAVDPDVLPVASGSGAAGASVEHAAEGEREEAEAAPFGEQDTAELVYQLARAELNGWDKDTVWVYMAKKLGRSPDDWHAYYLANVVDLLLKVAHKVGELLAAQQRKRDAAAAAAAAQQEKDEAERLERERAEAAAAAAAAEEERVRLEKEREDAQRRAREAEEQREREEQARLDAEEEALKRAAAEAEEREERERVERVEADKVRAEKTRQARREKDRARRKEGASTSPPPFSSQEQRPVAGKPTSTAQPAAPTVLTPRSTPPLRAAAAPLFLPSSPTTRASIEAMYGPDLAAIDEDDDQALPAPDASGSSLPHLSQYSVAPSPFLDGHVLAGRRENGGDADELGSGADTDDRELDEQLKAAVAPTVKVERDDDDAQFELEQHAVHDDSDDVSIWDPLLDVEYNLIIDSHELVEALSARAAAAAAELDAGPLTAEQPTAPSSKKRRRTESPARATTDELEQHEHEQPASKRQRVVDEHVVDAFLVAQPAQGPAPVDVAPAPPLRSSPSVPRRVPRASLAAVASASPAPPAPAPVAAPAPAPTPTPAPSATARRPLKDELAAVSAASGLSYTAVRDLYFCVSALSDLSILRDVALFSSPPAAATAAGQRLEEGTAEWERARRRVDKYVWSAREDEVVLEGTDEARARVDERKGAGSVERRREFLRRAKMTKIADLRASLYSRKA